MFLISSILYCCGVVSIICALTGMAWEGEARGWARPAWFVFWIIIAAACLFAASITGTHSNYS